MDDTEKKIKFFKKPVAEIVLGATDEPVVPDVTLDKAPEIVKPALTEVVMLTGEAVIKEGVSYLAVVTTGSAPKGYLVKAESVENKRSPQKIDLSAAISLYDWSDEIKYLIPDVETVRKNLLLSFWSAGAYEQKDAAVNKVRNSMFDRAYPYRLP